MSKININREGESQPTLDVREWGEGVSSVHHFLPWTPPGSEVSSEDIIVNKTAKGSEGLLVETPTHKVPSSAV